MHAIYIYKKKCTAGEHGKDAKVSMVVQVYEGCESKRGSTSVRTMRCHEESKGSCKKKRRETSTPCEMKNEMKRPEWNVSIPEAEYNGPKGERTERTELWMMKRRMIVMKRLKWIVQNSPPTMIQQPGSEPPPVQCHNLDVPRQIVKPDRVTVTVCERSLLDVHRHTHLSCPEQHIVPQQRQNNHTIPKCLL